MYWVIRLSHEVGSVPSNVGQVNFGFPFLQLSPLQFSWRLCSSWPSIRVGFSSFLELIPDSSPLEDEKLVSPFGDYRRGDQLILLFILAIIWSILTTCYPTPARPISSQLNLISRLSIRSLSVSTMTVDIVISLQIALNKNTNNGDYKLRWSCR